MTDLLLHPTLFPALLAALAVATPLLAAAAARWRPPWGTPRGRIALGATGPIILVAWFAHNLVLDIVGFDRVASVAIILGTALAVGLAAGTWIARQR